MDYPLSMWDERFRDGARPYGTEPSLYLKSKAHLFSPGGRVLVPGDGGGRNGVWLAKNGFDVLALDYSMEGLLAARRWAHESGVAIKTEQADVTTWAWPIRCYDAIVSVYLHLHSEVRAKVHHAMLGALKRGGFLVVEGFHLDQMSHNSGGPRNPDMLYTEHTLRQELAKATILEIRRDVVELDESPLHRGPAVLVRLTAKAN